MPLESSLCCPRLALRSGCGLGDATLLWPASAGAQSPSLQNNGSRCSAENSHFILCPVAPVLAAKAAKFCLLCTLPTAICPLMSCPWVFSSELKNHSAPSHFLQTGWCFSLNTFLALSCTLSSMSMSLLCWGAHSIQGMAHQHLTPWKKLLQGHKWLCTGSV